MTRKMFWTMLAFEAGLGIVALPLLALLNLPVVVFSQWEHWDLLLGAAAAILTYATLVAAMQCWSLFQHKLGEHIRQLRHLFSGLSLTQFVLIASAAGIGEELLFRVLLQSWFNSWLPAALAILISALAFAALHWLSLTYFLVTLAMGLAFGTVYYFTQSFVLVASWHGVYDLIALLVVAHRPHWLLAPR